jgi:hypothetical protein
MQLRSSIRLSLPALAALALASCGAHPVRVAESPKTKVHAVYEAHAHTDGTIDVAVTLPAGSPLSLGLDDGMAGFVSRLRVGETPIASPHWDGSSLDIDRASCAAGCTVRYRFDISAAAESGYDADAATAVAGTYVTCPSAWLLRPEHAGDDATFELDVDVDPPMDFAFGAPAEPGARKVYKGALGDLDEPPYAALGMFRRLPLDDVGGLEVVVSGPTPSIGDDGIAHWITEAVKNLRTVYPGYPKHHALLAVLVEPGARVGKGTAMGNGGASIQVHLGEAATEADTGDDWILTHEMFHLAFPGLARTHHWAEEGMATYLEPIARARRGVIPVERVWRDWLDNMHLGEPFEDDQGLDQTASWGRTYWGGALFWFVSDVEVRKATANAHGAPDFFAAIYQKADIADRWPMTRVVEESDRASGSGVLAKLYSTHATHPVKVDLDNLFRDLGVSAHEGKVQFDDSAPLAAVRKAIVTGPTKP